RRTRHVANLQGPQRVRLRPCRPKVTASWPLRHQADRVGLGDDRPIGTAKLIALHFQPHRQPRSL
ncbi:hypothetical protein, partial [Chromohalobacter sp. HP20-39]|uniref:hypothetical protein n=1 Tax=Chromohalobacter sp. HP20-39 TaxID=3079306 RepID=UPI00294AC64D